MEEESEIIGSVQLIRAQNGNREEPCIFTRFFLSPPETNLVSTHHDPLPTTTLYSPPSPSSSHPVSSRALNLGSQRRWRSHLERAPATQISVLGHNPERYLS